MPRFQKYLPLCLLDGTNYEKTNISSFYFFLLEIGDLLFPYCTKHIQAAVHSVYIESFIPKNMIFLPLFFYYNHNNLIRNT